MFLIVKSCAYYIKRILTKNGVLKKYRIWTVDSLAVETHKGNTFDQCIGSSTRTRTRTRTRARTHVIKLTLNYDALNIRAFLGKEITKH